MSLSPDEVRAAFFQTDTDHSGDLNIEEFSQFCSNTSTVFLAVEKKRKKSDKQPWNKCELNRPITAQSRVSSFSFRGIPKEPVSPDKVDKAEMAFKLYDRDKDGFVTKSEMNRIAKNLTTDQIDKVL